MPAATMCERPAGIDPDESRLAHLRFKAAEYTDLFWFDVLGRLPVVGHRLSEYRSDRNYRRE